jgi:hypothetical protein
MQKEKQNSSFKNNVFKCKCYKQERKAQFWQFCQQIQWQSPMLREKGKKSNRPSKRRLKD